MKHLFADLNKVFENKNRLGIMALLAVNESQDFNTLKESLGLTDGNLASHLKLLQKENYIDVVKSFVNNKSNTKYFATQGGKLAFNKHLNALEKIIKGG